MTDRSQVKLQPDGIHASSDGSFVPSVVFENAKCALGLDRSVPSEQGAVDAVERVQNFPVYRSAFPVETDGAVLFRFLALFGIRAATAVLFILTAIAFFHFTENRGLPHRAAPTSAEEGHTVLFPAVRGKFRYVPPFFLPPIQKHYVGLESE